MVEDTARNEVHFMCETAEEFKHLLFDDCRKAYVRGSFRPDVRIWRDQVRPLQ